MNRYKEYCEKIIETIKLFDEYEIKDIINDYLEHTGQNDFTIMDWEDMLDYIEGEEEEMILLLGMNTEFDIYKDKYFIVSKNGNLKAIDINKLFDLYSYEIAEYMIDNENCFYYTTLEEIVEDFWSE